MQFIVGMTALHILIYIMTKTSKSWYDVWPDWLLKGIVRRFLYTPVHGPSRILLYYWGASKIAKYQNWWPLPLTKFVTWVSIWWPGVFLVTWWGDVEPAAILIARIMKCGLQLIKTTWINIWHLFVYFPNICTNQIITLAY